MKHYTWRAAPLPQLGIGVLARAWTSLALRQETCSCHTAMLDIAQVACFAMFKQADADPSTQPTCWLNCNDHHHAECLASACACCILSYPPEAASLFTSIFKVGVRTAHAANVTKSENDACHCCREAMA